jgi:Hemolysin coregulated protein Hcp (TssD)
MSLDTAKGIFTAQGKQFEIRNFTTSVTQATDERERPSATPCLRQTTLTLVSNANSDLLIAWAISHNQKIDCTIETRQPEEDQTERKIDLLQAFCVAHSTIFDSNSTMLEHIVLTCEEMTNNGVTINSRWTK